MAKRVVRKAKTTTPNKSVTVISYWIIALLTAFLLLGSIARPLLWIFVVGAILTYFTLKK
ncbi:MAG: hypothetical protein HY431_02755 [Candidatus Levybacteria bacterium]|nr:hypothetical protein [Candidatus Levybacteria bacterium]